MPREGTRESQLSVDYARSSNFSDLDAGFGMLRTVEYAARISDYSSTSLRFKRSYAAKGTRTTFRASTDSRRGRPAGQRPGPASKLGRLLARRRLGAVARAARPENRAQR